MMPPENPTDTPDLLPAPDVPPDVYIMSSEERRQGVLVVSDWLINGRIVSRRPGDYVEWPSAIHVPDSDTVTIKIVTQSAPAELEIRQYSAISPNGFAPDERLMTTSWLHPDLFHSRGDASKGVLRYSSEDSLPGWEFDVRFPPSSDVVFIRLWATWRGPYSANWNLSARR